MIYPITIIDDFFSDPDAIVKMASELEYFDTEDGRWPGKRTRPLHEVNSTFHNFFARRLLSTFHTALPNCLNAHVSFQLVDPFVENEDKWDKENRGWIHADSPCQFGGIVYLTKDPDPDTGTSIYRAKRGFHEIDPDAKEKLYQSKEMRPGEYSKGFDEMFYQFEETVSVSNVYNRLMLFDGTTLHGVRTFGTKRRLTLSFFFYDLDILPPLYRFGG